MRRHFIHYVDEDEMNEGVEDDDDASVFTDDDGSDVTEDDLDIDADAFVGQTLLPYIADEEGGRWSAIIGYENGHSWYVNRVGRYGTMWEAVADAIRASRYVNQRIGTQPIPLLIQQFLTLP